MLALGIDPGTAICGYGLVRLERSRLIPVHYGAVFYGQGHAAGATAEQNL